MTRDDSARVNEFFEANSRDLTPAPARHAAHVLYAPVSRDPEVTRRSHPELDVTANRPTPP